MPGAKRVQLEAAGVATAGQQKQNEGHAITR